MSQLDELVDTWMELADAMTIRDVATKNVPPASLATGAAGIAYVLARLERERRKGGALEASKRWLGIASRASRKPFRAPDWPKSTTSVMFGPLGVAAVAAMLTPRAIGDYIAAVKRRMAHAPAELMQGLAGNTFVAIVIARETGDARVSALVHTLAARLAAAPLPNRNGFAHGDAGVLAARIAAARFCGDPIDPAIVRALAAIGPEDVLAHGGTLARAWCNGLAGHILAWVLAAEQAGSDACRAHAIAAGRHLLDKLDEAGASLCCGLGGRAYALLAIARLDPEGPWVEHAVALGTRATAFEVPAGGVMQGLPGIVLLAHDLRTPRSARFPLVDVIA